MSRFHHTLIFYPLFFALLVSAHACIRPHVKISRIEKILSVVRKALPCNSFEVYDFKVGWYNALVDPKFRLAYSNDTVALSTHTIPGVFKNAFLPFICEKGLTVANDSWPQFSKYYMQKVQLKLKKKLNMVVPDEDILYPHIMLGPGHPLILVQTAAHVAGAAYYYQRKDVVNDPWPLSKKIYGVSLHPKYGGWFFMGPVIILRDEELSDLQQKQVKDVLVDDARKIELLNLYNGDWRNQKWRDVINVEKKYSHDHLTYSMTYGAKRTSWVEKFYADNCKGE